MPINDNNDFSILFDPAARARVVAATLRGDKPPPVADELAQALERARGSGDLANLLAASGDPAMGQLARGIQHQADQSVQVPEQRLRYAKEAEQARAMADRSARLRTPTSQATVLRRALADRIAPDIDVSQATGEDLDELLPSMTRLHGFDTVNAARLQAAQMRSAAPGRGRGAGGAGAGLGPVKDIADAIESGKQPPEIKGLFKYGPLVRAELGKRGFDLSAAVSDWFATQKHLASLNGTQQTKLRQAVQGVGDQLDMVERLYNEWKAIGATTGLKAFNRASLAVAKQLGGGAGAAAHALEGQINLLAGEIGQVLQGGNSPTDHALMMGEAMLESEWDQPTFEAGLNNLKKDVQIRRNSLAHSLPAGTSAGNLYARQAGGEEKSKEAALASSVSAPSSKKSEPADKIAAAKAKLPAGEVLIRRGGKIGAVPSGEVKPDDERL